MARRRGSDRKAHVHQPGVRCSRCRPLSKAEVAKIAPPPPPSPRDAPGTSVTDIQRFAYAIRARASGKVTAQNQAAELAAQVRAGLAAQAAAEHDAAE